MVQQGEKRLLNEWLAEKHREHLTMRNLRLGKATNTAEAKMYSVTQRYADAIVIDNGTIYIIEAKIRATPAAVGQLEHYGTLIKETPEFSQYADAPVKLVLLSAFEDLATRKMCEDKNMLFELYPREWII